jgi:hypothetical protein
MKSKSLLALIVISFILLTAVTGYCSEAIEEQARQSFEQILDLWRAEDYAGLYTRLTRPDDLGWAYYASRIIRHSKKPACCWEKLQDVDSTVIGKECVIINAKVGIEAKGAGTRFVTRKFTMSYIDGIWKLPMQDILDLSQ